MSALPFLPDGDLIVSAVVRDHGRPSLQRRGAAAASGERADLLVQTFGEGAVAGMKVLALVPARGTLTSNGPESRVTPLAVRRDLPRPVHKG